MINNHIIAKNYKRQGSISSPTAVFVGTNGWALCATHRQCIFDFQKK